MHHTITVDEQLKIDEFWMAKAIEQARQAQSQGEVPVGAVVIKDQSLIASGWNHPIDSNDPSAHAEMMAMRNAGQQLNNYRLLDTTLYVTLEPCVMCAGAMIHARIKRLVFGAKDPKTGAAGGQFDLLMSNRFNHQIEITAAIREQECGELLRDFFKNKR